MTFLQSAFLGALGLAALPLLLHLLTRRRLRDAPFPAYMFLLGSNRRSMRLLTVNQWLVMLLRMLAIACAALAFAMPALKRAGWLPPGSRAPVAVRVIVDNTPSMKREKNGVSLLERAASAAEKILSAAAPEDEVVVEPLCGSATIRKSGSKNNIHAARIIKEFGAAACEADISRRARLAEAALLEAPFPSRRLVVISDFQDSAMSAPQTKEGGPAVPVALVDLSPAGKFPDAWPESASLPLFPLKGEELPICAKIRFSGGFDGSAQVALFVDDVKRGEKNISAAGSTASEICFTVAFPDTGARAGKISISGDSFSYNNDLYFNFKVGATIRVGLISDEEKLSDPSGESFYIQRALRATAGSVPGEKTTETTVYSIGALKKALATEAVVVIPGETELSGDDLAAIGAFVADGGGALLTAGGADDDELVAHSLFGGSIDIEKKKSDKKGGTAESFASVGRVDSSSQLFNHPAGRFIADDMISSRFAAPAVAKATNPEISAIASFTNGNIFLAGRKIGKGQAMIVASPLRPDATNLVLKPSFVPLVLQIVRYLNAPETESYSMFRDGERIALKASLPADSMEILDSTGAHAGTLKKINGSDSYATTETLSPGAYRAVSGNSEIRFAVGPSEREMKLEKADSGKLAALAGKTGIIADASRMLDDRKLIDFLFAASGAALWFPLFAASIIFLLAETALSNRR